MTYASYSPLIDYAIQKRDEGLLLRLMENMKIDNLPPNINVFKGLLLFYFEKDDLDSLVRVVQKLSSKGLRSPRRL